VPPVEVCEILILLRWNGVSVERFMMGVSQLKVGKPFVFFDKTVANDLNLWLMRNFGQVMVKNAPLVNGLSMTVNSSGGIESSRELVLRLRGEILLVFDHHNLMLIQGFV
jgi:hypothetical protein